jgi:hypothetical protein
VVRDLPAPIDLNDRDVARRQDMFAIRIQAQSVNRRVFEQPDFVRCPRPSPIGERGHGGQRVRIIDSSELSDDDRKVTQFGSRRFSFAASLTVFVKQ